MAGAYTEREEDYIETGLSSPSSMVILAIVVIMVSLDVGHAALLAWQLQTQLWAISLVRRLLRVRSSQGLVAQ